MNRIFFAYGESPFGRRPLYPDDPVASLRKIFLKQTEYIHSTFDVGRSSVSSSIKMAAFQAGGGAWIKLYEIGDQCHQQNINFSWERLPAAKKSRSIAIIAAGSRSHNQNRIGE